MELSSFINTGQSIAIIILPLAVIKGSSRR